MININKYLNTYSRHFNLSKYILDWNVSNHIIDCFHCRVTNIHF